MSVMQELTPEGSLGGLLSYLAHPLSLCLVSVALALFVVARRNERMRRAALAAIVAAQPRSPGLAPAAAQAKKRGPADHGPLQPGPADCLAKAQPTQDSHGKPQPAHARTRAPRPGPSRLPQARLSHGPAPSREQPREAAPRAAALDSTPLVRYRRSSFTSSPDEEPNNGPRDSFGAGPGNPGLSQISLRATLRYKLFSGLCALIFPALLFGTTLFDQPAGERGILLPVLGYGLCLLSGWHALWVLLWRLDYDSIGLSTRNRLFQPEARMWRALTGITSDGPFITLFHFADGLVMRVPNFIQGRRHMILMAQSWLHDGHAPDRP